VRILSYILVDGTVWATVKILELGEILPFCIRIKSVVEWRHELALIFQLVHVFRRINRVTVGFYRTSYTCVAAKWLSMFLSTVQWPEKPHGLRWSRVWYLRL